MQFYVISPIILFAMFKWVETYYFINKDPEDKKTEAYSQLSQISKMELFAKIVSDSQPLTIFS